MQTGKPSLAKLSSPLVCAGWLTFSCYLDAENTPSNGVFCSCFNRGEFHCNTGNLPRCDSKARRSRDTKVICARRKQRRVPGAKLPKLVRAGWSQFEFN